MISLTCTHPDCNNLVEGRTGLCATHNKQRRALDNIKLPDDKEPVKKQSSQMAAMMRIYIPKAKKFIKGKMCAVLKNVPATEVHHRAGRGINTYYDEWAKERGINLLLDERFWLPVSREGHTEIEKRPAWAKKMGYSEDRLITRINTEL
jgi:hypothetical protein